MGGKESTKYQKPSNTYNDEDDLYCKKLVTPPWNYDELVELKRTP